MSPSVHPWVSVDSAAVASTTHDQSGVTTIGHEMFHVGDFLGGKSWEEIQRGDKPNSESGPAEAAGRSWAAERPDLSEAEAAKLIDEWLKDGAGWMMRQTEQPKQQ